jgi:hypothetical protein
LQGSHAIEQVAPIRPLQFLYPLKTAFSFFKKLLISSIDSMSFTALSYNLELGCFLSITKPELVLSSSNQENSLIVSSTIFSILSIFLISEKSL